jgi:hypothetical protein
VNAGVLVLLVGATISLSAFELTLDFRSIDQAIALGRSSNERDRDRFHAAYRLPVSRTPVDYIDIVTPFRRLVLAAYQQGRAGNRTLSQRQALALQAASPGWVDVVVELTFHPMNAYVNVPPYAVALRTPAGASIEPRALDRMPRFGPRVDGTPRPGPGTLIERRGQPMLGGTLLASFDGARLPPDGIFDVVVTETGKEIGQARVELETLR